MAAVASVEGAVSPGFERVATAFRENFLIRGELGAAFAAYCGEELIVDLWGGVADRDSARPWRRDTIQTIFSGTKGLVTTALLLLIEPGLLALDDPVCRYWPEFGKPDISVRDVVSHRARLPGIDVPVSHDDFLDGAHMAELLARQQRSTDPRAEFCYHPMTWGWLCGEIVRRIDGRDVGTFFAEEIARPLGLDIWIGLPEPEEPRVATLELGRTWPAAPFLDPERFNRDPFLYSVWGNPPVILREGFPWNSRAFRAAAIPAAGAVATARSMAKLYANLGRLLSERTLALARTPLAEGRDPTLDQEYRFGIGFQLATARGLLGPEPTAFGHPGAGGSVHGCWPNESVGFSYATNLLRDDEASDTRAAALLRALHDSLRERVQPSVANASA